MPIFVKEVVITGDIRGEATATEPVRADDGQATPSPQATVAASLGPDIQRRIREMVRAELRQEFRRKGEN